MPFFGVNRNTTDPVYLFKDKKEETELIAIDEPYWKMSRYAYKISNRWKGGKLNIKCVLGEDGNTMTLTVSSPDQPDFHYPDNIYVIGDFNDWKIPSPADANGAVILDKRRMYEKDGTEMRFFNSSPGNIPSGKARYVYYYVDPVTKKDRFLEGIGTPFEIHAGKGGSFEANIRQRFPNLETAKENPFEIVNYTGEELRFEVRFDGEKDYPNQTTVNWPSSPDIDLPDLYVQIKEGNNVRFEKAELGTDNKYYISQFYIHEDCEITLVPYDNQEDIEYWGVHDAAPAKAGSTSMYHIIPYGEPLYISHQCSTSDNAAFTFVSVAINKINNLIEVETDLFNPDAIEDVWLIKMNTGSDRSMDKTDAGIFETSWHYGYEDPFYFKTELNGWTNVGSLGSSLKQYFYKWVDFNETDHTYNSEIILNGRGVWTPPEECEDGWIKIRIDLHTLTLTVTDLNQNGVEDVMDDDESSVRYFNLQGFPVENPSKGMFIRFRNGKSEKILL